MSFNDLAKKEAAQKEASKKIDTKSQAAAEESRTAPAKPADPSPD